MNKIIRLNLKENYYVWKKTKKSGRGYEFVLDSNSTNFTITSATAASSSFSVLTTVTSTKISS